MGPSKVPPLYSFPKPHSGVGYISIKSLKAGALLTTSHGCRSGEKEKGKTLLYLKELSLKF